ncbi:hypothetical protein [Paenibacillus sp. NEAU-GSW1]|uniref:hypothetical protein n=1 Tax=Paenibacillus sp. NEAU-GSW1 TaxID=2682486 RepID=UPI0012E1267F|nr:hypothetical protein [Paenibacillus sp. NEAU-GSW1]MUT68721.1 hypothetical protein [Paenibacillus sp. NEAU-GSW1]
MKKMTMIAVAALAFFTSVSLVVAGSREYAPVVQTPSMKTVYVDRIAQESGRLQLVVDEIEWYEGDEAAAKFVEREQASDMDAPPDGYYIINDEHAVVSLPVAKDAVVLMQIYNRTGNAAEADIVWDEQISLTKFVDLFEAEDAIQLSNYPYHLTIENGVVTRIVQQYIP